MRVTPVPSWTAPSWRVTPTRCWRRWPSAATASVATKGFIYIRAEYPLAIRRLKVAIAQARDYGLLGEQIFGTSFSFDISLKYGAGAFVCGEETALIHSMEGKRGEPANKPPSPLRRFTWASPPM